ncbi:hypothetical protein BRX37_16480 [Sphingomonas sp. S-NIH.Pt3_0716]|nr:hypothetical protein BRX37_16480 [Sphingomonas sp. S-NIH.Pt3_0716]
MAGVALIDGYQPSMHSRHFRALIAICARCALRCHNANSGDADRSRKAFAADPRALFCVDDARSDQIKFCDCARQRALELIRGKAKLPSHCFGSAIECGTHHLNSQSPAVGSGIGH